MIESNHQSVRLETKSLLLIAVPLIGAYLAELAMVLTTKIVVGRLGYEELAAVGIAATLAFEFLVVVMGLLSVVGVFIAQAEAQGDRGHAGHACRQGLLVAVIVGIPTTLLVFNLDDLLALTKQDPRVLELAHPYLVALSPSIIPILAFSVLRSFVAALAKTGAVLLISVAAVGLNYVLTIGLVEGRYGMPAYGVAGAGAATSIVSWLMFIGLGIYIYCNSALRGYGLFRSRLRFDPSMWKALFVLGLPVAGIVFLEAGLFATVSILSGVIGAKSLAAYEIIMGWVSVPFLVALGLAEAVMVRVAYGAGRNDMVAARYSGLVGLVLGFGLLAALVVIPVGLPELIIDLFLSRDDPGYEDVAALAKTLLVIAAIFQIFDGMQAIAARALRAVKDTVVPLWIAGFGYWVLGIGIGSMLAFGVGLETVGLWLGMATGLIVTGSLLAWRFLSLTSRQT